LTRIKNVRNTTKFKRSIKAISPVIATLLMIAIAVVASLVVYAWVTGYIGGSTTKAGKAIAIPSFGLQGTNLHVYVQNVGQGQAEIGAVYIDDARLDDAALTFSPSKVVSEGNTIEITVTGNYDKDTRYDIKVTTTDGTFMTATGKPGSGGSTNPSSPSVVVTSFAITAPAESTDGTVTTGSSFTVKAMIHVSSGSVSVSATPTFPSGYTGAAAVSHTVGTTDVEFSWTITAPSSASASAAVTLSAIATGYTSDTDNTFNVATETVQQKMHVSSISVSVQDGGWNDEYGRAYVYIVDSSGNAVSGATVSVSWTIGSNNGGTDSGTTDANGRATVASNHQTDGSRTYTVTVTGVAKSGWTYDSSANVETSDSATG
jgi:archaeal type IV pilus assembly protein PilA